MVADRLCGSSPTTTPVRCSGRCLCHEPSDARSAGSSSVGACSASNASARTPSAGAEEFTDLTAPTVTDAGTRIPGLRFGGTRVHAPLQALLIHRRYPQGSPTVTCRTLVALLGTTHLTEPTLTPHN